MTATGRESAKIFERYVYEVAGQLWSERICLPQILQHSRLHPLRDHLEGVQSYEELFRLMLTKGVIAPDDFSVLCELLLELNRSDLLHPLYENFGRKGRKLSTGERTSTSTSRRSPLLSAVKTGSSSEFRFLLYSIGSNISMENLKTLLFLVRDLLPRSKVENIEEGSELLELLRQRNCIHEQRPEFLYTLLRDIGRDDLRSSVDEYVYGHLKAQQSFPNDPWLAPDKRHWYRKCSEEESGETENTRWFQQSYKYRLALKQLADKLTPSDLDSMKHMCNDIIPKQQLEKVGHTLDLFVALEDHDMLSLNDITFLENLLKEKKHLLRPLYTRLESSQPSSRNNTLTLQFRRPLMADNKYKMMLRKLGIGLGKREIRELKRLQHKRNHDTEGIQTGCELLQHWEEMGFISQQNTDFLQKCLTTIGRKDLIMHICAFRYFLQMQQQHEQEKPHIERTYTHEGQTTLSTLPVNSVFQHPISNGVHSDISSSIPSVSFSSGTASLNPTSDSSSPLTASYLPGIEALAKQVSEMSQTLQFQRVTNELQGELLKLHRDLQSKTDQFLLLDQRNRNLEEQLRETQIMLAREQGLRRQLELTNTTLKRENVYLHEENEELHLQLYEERVIIHRMQKEQRIQSQMKWASHFGIEVATPV